MEMTERFGVSALITLAVLTAGCTPTRYRLQPYRSDESKAHELSEQASEVCAAHRGAEDLPPHPFTSDGCSLWPDCSWVGCCIDHDIAYWCGGSANDRQRADRSLRQCVAEHGPTGMGTAMYIAVRAFGIPWQPFPFRWGYGWDGIRGYEQLEQESGTASDLPAQLALPPP